MATSVPAPPGGESDSTPGSHSGASTAATPAPGAAPPHADLTARSGGEHGVNRAAAGHDEEHGAHGAHDGRRPPTGRYLFALALGAVGVVYGDIGTSPLYALKECFSGPHGVAPTRGTCSACCRSCSGR
jgi:hypothetical protein